MPYFWVKLRFLIIPQYYRKIMTTLIANCLAHRPSPEMGQYLPTWSEQTRTAPNWTDPNWADPSRILYWSWHKISKIVINYTIFSKNYSQLVVKLLGSYTTHRNGIVLFEILRTRRLQQVLSHFWGWPVSWAICDQSCHNFSIILRNN